MSRRAERIRRQDSQAAGKAKALRGVVKELEAFSDPAWWQAEVDDLNACEVHGSAGEANHRAGP